MTDRGSDSLSWDAENRLTSATVDSATTDFAYNGDGLRDSLTYDSNTTTFTWDVNASVPQVLDDGDFRYVYGLGRIAEVDGSDNAYYYLPDGLGSTMALTDAAGAVENTYEYDPFGAIERIVRLAGQRVYVHGRADGREYEPRVPAGRYYDPQTGGFVSRDPLTAIPFWPEHPYAYVGSSPQNFMDPYGLLSLNDISAALRSLRRSARHLAKEGGFALNNFGEAAVSSGSWCIGDSTCRSVALTAAILGGTVVSGGVIDAALAGEVVLGGWEAVQLTAGVTAVGTGVTLDLVNATNSCSKAAGTYAKIGSCAAIPASALSGTSSLSERIGVRVLPLFAQKILIFVDDFGGAIGQLLNHAWGK